MTKIHTADVTFNETVIHRQTFGCIDKNGRYKVRKRTKKLPLVDESFCKPSEVKVERGPVLFRECRALSERYLSKRPATKISKAHASPSWKENFATDELLRIEEFSEEGIKKLYADTFIETVYPTQRKRVPPHTPQHLWKKVILSPLHLGELKSALGAHSIQRTALKTYCITYFRDSESQRKYSDRLITRIMRTFFAAILIDF